MLKVAKDQQAAEGRIFICSGAHVWGKGKTPDEARKKARSQGPSGSPPYEWVFIDAPADAYIDEYGRLCWVPKHKTADGEVDLETGRWLEVEVV